MTRDFAGNPYSDSEVEDEYSEDLEDLYSVIEELKADEWSDVPASYLPLQEVLVDQAVPRTYKEAMASDQATLWMDACKVEHDALVRNNVYEWAELPVMVGNDKNNPLPCKWIFNIKRRADGTIERYKARIVAGGHRQKEGIDFKETLAPVAKFVSLRTLLTIVALENLETRQGDIVTAFLYGELDEVVYMRPPAGLTPSEGQTYIDCTGNQQCLKGLKPLYWKLHRSLYGLRQSPRCFYKRLDAVVGQHGYTRIPADYGVWIAPGTVLMLVHVNDIQLFGTPAGIQ